MAETEAGTEAETEAGTEAGTEAETEAGTEAETEAGTEAEAETEAGTGGGYLVVEGRLAVADEDELPFLVDGLPVLGIEVGAVDGDDRVAVKICLAAGEATAAAAVERLLAGRGAVEVRAGAVAAEDWMAAYREVVTARAVGRTWWLDPHPHSPSPAPPGRTRLLLEPRMAFGTGSHESTQLMLEVLEDRDLAGLRVLDVGTGCGVLALACLARGAARAVGVDIDPQSIWVARETALVQERPWRPQLVVGSSGCVAAGAFDLVLCNMISERFTPLLADLGASLAPAGTLLLAGLLAVEREEVEASVAGVGLRVVAARGLGEWLSLEVER